MSARAIVLLLLLLLTTVTLFCPTVLAADLEEEEKIELLSARSSSLGGSHAALADDLTSLFSNPAGFKSIAHELQITELTFGTTGPIFDIAGLVIQSLGDEDIEELLLGTEFQQLLLGLYASVDLLGPISFGYISNGIGFGFFNWLDVSFDTVSTFTIDTRVSENVMIAGGYALRIPLPEESNSTFDIGLLLKSIIKAEVGATRSIIDIVSLFSSDLTSFILDEPLQLSVGIGGDIGARFSYNELLSFGLVVQDIFTPFLYSNYSSIRTFFSGESPQSTSNGLVPLDLTAGVMFSPHLGELERYISGLKIMLDYHDILGFLTHRATYSNLVLLFGLGIEMSLLKILYLRAGFYQGLMAAGVGLDLGIVSVDAAAFGSELSTEPGLRSVYNLIIGFKITL